MKRDKWYLPSQLLNGALGEFISNTLAYHLACRVTVLRLEECAMTGLQVGSSFNCEAMGISSQPNLLIINKRWAMHIRSRIVLVHARIAKKMSSANSGNGNKVENSERSRNVMQLIDNSTKLIVKEIQDQIIVLLAHMNGFEKDMELLQKAMETLNVSMINLRY